MILSCSFHQSVFLVSVKAVVIDGLTKFIPDAHHILWCSRVRRRRNMSAPILPVWTIRKKVELSIEPLNKFFLLTNWRIVGEREK